MPIYEYTCLECDGSFEVMHRSPGGEKVVCPECGSAKIRKNFSYFAARVGSSVDIGACSGGRCGTGNSGSACPSGGCCGMTPVS